MNFSKKKKKKLIFDEICPVLRGLLSIHDEQQFLSFLVKSMHICIGAKSIIQKKKKRDSEFHEYIIWFYFYDIYITN